MVNQALVNHYWPKENPFGKRFRFMGPDYQKIVGVMSDVLPPSLPGENLSKAGRFFYQCLLKPVRMIRIHDYRSAIGLRVNPAVVPRIFAVEQM